MWDGHRTVLGELDAHVSCFNTAIGDGAPVAVNRIRIRASLVVDDIDGNGRVACGPLDDSRRDVARFRVRCVGEAHMPNDCKWHASASAWITRNGVRKTVTVRRDPWVLGGKARCT